MSLRPIIDMVGDYACRHGERGHDLDPDNPYACLCGEYDDYLQCPGEGIESALIEQTDDGIRISHDD